MNKDFILPDIGEGIVECEVVEWLVNEGDVVREDQPICDVMTDKALVQIPALHDGVITKFYHQKGEVAKVHAPLFAMNLTDEHAVNDPIVEQQTHHNPQLEDFILPDIGEGIVECEIVEWLVKEGDQITEDQAVCDVMTDKALVQIPAKHTGRINKLYYQKGEIAKVHQPLFQLALDTESNTVTQKIAPQHVTTTPINHKPAIKQGKAIASPAVRRLARECDIDIAKVSGSGKNGRVYKQDIHDFINGTMADVNSSVSDTSKTSKSAKTEKINGVKAIMAKQMMAAVSSIPHFTLSDEIDLTDLMALRERLKPQYEEQGVKLTMMPFFIKALSLAMKEYPIMNAQVNDDCTEITYLSDHNIGMAADTQLGLMVPNIKQCQDKNMIEIAQAVTRLTMAAREGRISPDDLKKGTISISNIGAIGGTTATPIINKPEVAIVALGKVQSLPRFNEHGEVVAKSMMNVSWSGDHRVIDGATMARFNNLWKSYLENPSLMMMNMN